jgi:O-antigen/teichoic acid export membrane protein
MRRIGHLEQSVEPESGARSKFREERVRLAVRTGLVSKAVALGVQAGAMPIAVRALGAERYGVFAVLAASIGWVALAGVGLNPSLTSRTSAVAARSDPEQEKRLFSTAFIAMTVVASVVAVLTAMAFLAMPVSSFFGAKYDRFAGEITSGVLAGILFMAGSLVVGVVEAAQLGYQEQHHANAWVAVGNAGSIISLLLVAWRWPSVMGLMISLFGVPLAARAANVAWFFTKGRPYLRPHLRSFDRAVVGGLLSTGIGFVLIQLTSFLNQQFVVFLTGRMVGPREVASLAVIMQVLLLISGLLSMYAQPLWPALMDAAVRGDVGWVQKSYRRALGVPMALAGFAGLGLAVCGRWVIGAWFGMEVAPDRALQASAGVYLILACWEYLHFTILVGLQGVWRSAIVLGAKSLIAVCLTLILVPRAGSVGATVALAVSALLVGVWAFPLLVRRAIRKMDLAARSGLPHAAPFEP